MTPSSKCLNLIKESEGERLQAYQDDKGIWTIGVGHTGPEVHRGLVWTQAQVDAQLQKDLARAANGVPPCRTQGEFDALTSFVFNLGEGQLLSSHLLQYHRAGLIPAAAAEFGKFVHSGPHIDSGLVIRRAREVLLYLGAS